MMRISTSCVALVATLFLSVQSQASSITLMDATTNGGSFEDAPGADNTSSASWTYQAAGTGGFNSLNRSLGPQGNPDPQDGTFTGVTNPGSGAHLHSNVIPATVVTGDVFEFSGYFGSLNPGMNFVVALLFSDGTVADLTAAGTAPGINGTRLVLPQPTPNDWVNMTQAYTYTGAGATSVQVLFEAFSNGGQTYFDDFSLTQTAAVPEPGSIALSMLALAGLGAVGMRRRLG